MKQRLLIVEDDAVNISLLSGLLREHYQISIARTKTRACEILDTEQIQIVLLDLNLPDGSGVDICDKYNRSASPIDEPLFIVMTGDTNKQTEIDCFAVGATEFITKPIDKHTFMARMKIQSAIIALQNQQA
ncbi:response regulator [Glaciecola sp. MH2013]|uniref:response regulator n=1 Tax=Glaciecola sp. MH2013 TaxID=2785524 RepID=UPI00189F9B04|nr:response regulator [Glaciecola sp. MH2013]MBF7072979.1 response regulator [Glaciecola sp. MH2013]